MRKIKLPMITLAVMLAAGTLQNCQEESPAPVGMVSATTDTGITLNDTEATEVPLNTTIIITFDRDIEVASANSNSIRFRQDETAVPADISASGATVTLKPKASLATGTKYKVIITDDLVAMDGSTASQSEFVFRSYGKPNVVPPQAANQLSYFSFSGNLNDLIGDHTPVAEDIRDFSYATDRFGYAGLAGNFNGTTMVEIPNGEQYMAHKSMTVSFWVKASAVRPGYFVLGLAASKGFYFELANDWASAKFVTQYKAANGTSDSEDNVFAGTGLTKDNGGWQGWTFQKSVKDVCATYFIEKWAHVVHTYDAATKLSTIYINGEKVKQTNFNLWDAADPKRTITGVNYAGNLSGGGNKLALGFIQGSQNRVVTASWADPSNIYSYHFRGQMDDLRFFKVALNDSEVNTLYMAEKP